MFRVYWTQINKKSLNRQICKEKNKNKIKAKHFCRGLIFRTKPKFGARPGQVLEYAVDIVLFQYLQCSLYF